MAAKKRFTFADAKEKIKELELELQLAKKDVKDDVKNFGYGDVVIFIAGSGLGYLIAKFLA